MGNQAPTTIDCKLLKILAEHQAFRPVFVCFSNPSVLLVSRRKNEILYYQTDLVNRLHAFVQRKCGVAIFGRAWHDFAAPVVKPFSDCRSGISKF